MSERLRLAGHREAVAGFCNHGCRDRVKKAVKAFDLAVQR